MNNYEERDIERLDEEGGYYSRHIIALTEEDLNSKSDIAAELAVRDFTIYRLSNDITALRKALLSAKVRLNSPLRMVKCKGFGELMRKIGETLKETEV